MEKTKIAVLISGSGSNLQALINACEKTDYPAQIVLVISNKKDAYGLIRAEKAGIKTVVISHKDFASREEFDQQMDKYIAESGAKLVCLAGFMRILSDWFVEKWLGKLINIHPSLLPDFKGLHAQQQALDAGVTEAGCTVHFATKEMDAGPIILQKKVPVLPDDTAETLSARILEQEHICYAEALSMVLDKSVSFKE